MLLKIWSFKLYVDSTSNSNKAWLINIKHVAFHENVFNVLQKTIKNSAKKQYFFFLKISSLLILTNSMKKFS